MRRPRTTRSTRSEPTPSGRYPHPGTGPNPEEITNVYPDTGIYLNFTFTCAVCGETVEVRNGVNNHPCPDPNVLVIEGCDDSVDLTTRVERALADREALDGFGVAQ